MENAINLSRVLIRWQFFVQILIAVFISTIAVGNFVYIPASRNISAFLIATTSILLWMLSFQIQRFRHLVQSAATFITLLLPATFGDPIDTSWMPLGYILFGLLFMTSFTMTSTYSYRFIFFVSLFHLFLTSRTTTDTLDDGLSWIYNLLVPSAFTYLFQKAFQRSAQIEKRFEILREEILLRETSKTIEDSKAAANRQIHETILNTLSVISGGIKKSQLDLAKATIERDLKLFDTLPTQTSSATLHECISAAVKNSAIEISDFTISIWPDRQISPTVAGVITDAVTEALRNIERHSQASSVRIEASVTDQITVAVVDNGVGIPDLVSESFGIKNTIKSSVRSLGGSSEVKSLPTGGSQVLINLPLLPEKSFEVETPKTASFFDIDYTIRAATQVGVLFLIFTTFYYYSRMTLPLLTLILVATLAVISVLLITKWDTELRAPLAIFGFLIQIAIELSFVFLNPYCAVVGFTQWSINANGLTSTLFLIAVNPIRQKIMWFLISRVAALSTVFFVPENCRNFPLATSISMVFFLGLFLSVVVWGVSKLDQQIEKNQNLWESLMASNLQKLTIEERQRNWDAVSREIKDYLNALVEKPRALLAPETSQFAAKYAGQIRSILSSQSAGGANNVKLGFLEDLQNELSLQIDKGEITGDTEVTELSVQVQRFIGNVIRTSECDSVRVRFLRDQNKTLMVFRLDNAKNFELAKEPSPNGILVELNPSRRLVLIEYSAN